MLHSLRRLGIPFTIDEPLCQVKYTRRKRIIPLIRNGESYILVSKIIETKSRMETERGRGQRSTGTCCLIGTEFQFYMMKFRDGDCGAC